MQQQIRTDLAMERLNLAQISHGRGRGVPGVSYRRKLICDIAVESVTIETQEAADILCKPIGSYDTVSLEQSIKRCDDSFSDTARCIAQLLRNYLPKRGNVLVACLGNPNITPDAVGPQCARQIMVTRHLKQLMPEDFADFASVSVITPGVLGTTGIESAQLVKGAVDAVEPDCVIVIDALAARGMDRLCRTVQISNTGIEPGSGVGNRRYALNRETLGVPVISTGIPTVVDAATLIRDITGHENNINEQGRGLFITPREIDTLVSDGSKLLAYGINFALHEDLTMEDVDLFIS